MPNSPFKSVDSFWRVKRKQKYPESMLTHCAQIFPTCLESARTDSKLRGEWPLSKKYLQAYVLVFFTSVVPSGMLLMPESFISLFIFILCVHRGILWPRNKNRMRSAFSKTKGKRKKVRPFSAWTGSQTRRDVKWWWSLRERFQTSDRDGVWTGFRHENYVALGHPLTVIYDATTFTHWHVIIWLKRGKKMRQDKLQSQSEAAFTRTRFWLLSQFLINMHDIPFRRTQRNGYSHLWTYD